MDEPRVYHIKWGKSRRERQLYHLYKEYLKNDINEFIYKTDSQTENKLMVLKGDHGGRGSEINQDFGININTLLCIK